MSTTPVPTTDISQTVTLKPAKSEFRAIDPSLFSGLVNQATLIDGQLPQPESFVQIGGKKVATVYNDGTIDAPGIDPAVLNSLPSMDKTKQHEPGHALAKQRADELAEALQGTVTPANAKAGQQAASNWALDYNVLAAAREERS